MNLTIIISRSDSNQIYFANDFMKVGSQILCALKCLQKMVSFELSYDHFFEICKPGSNMAKILRCLLLFFYFLPTFRLGLDFMKMNIMRKFQDGILTIVPFFLNM